MKPLLLTIILVIVVGLIAACGAGVDRPDMAQAPAAQNVTSLTFDTQSNDEKAVWVEVTPLNLPEGGSTLDFEVAFNTHSVDLGFDPVAISVLRDEAGREYPAIAWEGAAPGGHHRSGVLRFQVPDNATGFIEVVIHDVAGVPERVFRWSLK